MNNVSGKRLKGKRQSVYQFLIDYITENGFSPSAREIANGVGLKSASSVCNYLIDLERAGKIQTIPDTPRAIKLIDYEFVKVR